MARQRGWVETFQHDQLVVALSDLPALEQTLSSFGVGWKKIDKNAALGMALVRDLTDVPKAVHELAQRDVIGPELERYRAERERALPCPVADLDLLIKGIRVQLTQQFPGWEVTIGKNYGPSLVKGYPHVNGGGDGEPKFTDAAFSTPVCGHDRNRQRGRGVRVGLLDTRMFPDQSLAGHYIAGPVTSSTPPISARSRCSTGTARLSAPASCSKHRPLNSWCATFLTKTEKARRGKLPPRWRKSPRWG